MTSKYQELADDLQKKILAGEYQIGEAIPTEYSLRQQYQVSRHTVRQALSLLINEGYLKAERGSGTFVRNYKESTFQTTGTIKTIGVITTYLSDYIFPNIVEGIEKLLRENGYTLMLASTNNDPKQEEKCIQRMLSQGVCGLLVEPTSSNEYNPNIEYYLQLREKGIPVYFLNAYYDLLDFSYASLDDFSAGYQSTKYLIDKGHRNIGLITKMDDLQGKLRMKGFVKCHDDEKVALHTKYITTFSTKTQKSVIKKYVDSILLKEEAPSAVVCYNDQVASQLMILLKERGLNVPEDISIISHDDSYLAQAQQLTSVIHPKQKLGEQAATQLLHYLDKRSQMQTIEYEAKIAERESVKKL